MSLAFLLKEIQSTQFLIGLFVFLLIVVVSTVTFDFMKKRKKGEVQFDIPKRKYRPGDRIEGAIVVHAKKAVQVEKVTLKILCYTIRKSRSANGSENLKEIVLIRTENVVAKDFKIPNSQPYRVPLAFVLPYKIEPDKDAPPKQESAMGFRADFSRDPIEYNWDLGTIVKMTGVDFASVTSLTVDMQGFENDFAKAVSERM